MACLGVKPEVGVVVRVRGAEETQEDPSNVADLPQAPEALVASCVIPSTCVRF